MYRYLMKFIRKAIQSFKKELILQNNEKIAEIYRRFQFFSNFSSQLEQVELIF